MSPVTTKRRFSQESPLGEGAPGDPLHTARLRGFAVGLWSGRGLGHGHSSAFLVWPSS